MSGHTSTIARISAAFAAALLAFTLAGCGTDVEDAAGRTDKEAEIPVNPESDEGERTVPEYEVKAVLPESFPSDSFALPEGVRIYDAGERSADQWYLVLLADDAAAADAIWNEIIETNNLSVEDEDETVEGGRTATLNGALVSVQAMTLPQTDGSVQLSFDILGWN